MWHTWGTEELRTAFLWRKPKGDYFEDLEIDGRILLIQIYKKWLIGVMDWLGLAQDTGRWGDSCESDEEPSGFIQCGEFLD